MKYSYCNNARYDSMVSFFYLGGGQCDWGSRVYLSDGVRSAKEGECSYDSGDWRFGGQLPQETT